MSIKEITQYLFEMFLKYFSILTSPSETFSNIYSLSNKTSNSDSIIYAIIMLSIATSVSFIIDQVETKDTGSFKWIAVGTLIVWMFYGIFLHLFVLIYGGDKGIMNTISLYLYVQGTIQPTSMIFLYFFARFFGQIKNQIVSQAGRLLGMSSGGWEIIKEGKMLTIKIEVIYQLILGASILVYFTIGLRYSQNLSTLLSILCSTTAAIVSVFSFFLVYFIINFHKILWPVVRSDKD